MYRVVCNWAMQHLQWIVVRDDNERPIMIAGPYGDERAAWLHCDALNREGAPPPPTYDAGCFRWALEPALAIRLLERGWRGCVSLVHHKREVP